MESFQFTITPSFNDQISQDQLTIKTIIQKMMQQSLISFQQGWVDKLLQLFRNIEQMKLFWQLFNQSIFSKDTQHVQQLGLIYKQQSNIECCQMQQDRFINEFEELNVNIDNLEFEQQQENSLFTKNGINYENSCQNKEYPSLKSIEERSALSHSSMTQQIQRLLYRNPYLTIEQIQMQLQNIQTEEIPNSISIQQSIYHLNYSKRKLNRTSINTNSLTNIQNRYKYCKKIRQVSSQKLKMFYLDFHCFDMNLCPQFMWVKIGQTVDQSVNDEHICLFAALSQDGQCYWKTIHKTQNYQLNLLQIIEGIFLMIHAKNPESKILIIMNGIQVNKQLKQLFSSRQWKLVLMAPYSPQLNPLIKWFNAIKVNLQIFNKQIQNIFKLHNYLDKICGQLCKERRYFQEINHYILKGLTKSLF